MERVVKTKITQRKEIEQGNVTIVQRKQLSKS